MSGRLETVVTRDGPGDGAARLREFCAAVLDVLQIRRPVLRLNKRQREIVLTLRTQSGEQLRRLCQRAAFNERRDSNSIPNVCDAGRRRLLLARRGHRQETPKQRMSASSGKHVDDSQETANV